MATQWTVANDAIHHCRGYHRDEANCTCINTEVRKAPAKDIIKRDILHIHMYFFIKQSRIIRPWAYDLPLLLASKTRRDYEIRQSIIITLS